MLFSVVDKNVVWSLVKALALLILSLSHRLWYMHDLDREQIDWLLTFTSFLL